MSESAGLRIGYIGLGTMGLPMARLLAARGHALSVLDRDPARVESLLEDAPGVRPVRQASDVVDASDVIITCLPSEDDVREVYLESDSALARSARADMVTIDHSTVSPALARSIHDAFAGRGIVHVEAPLFGGVREAEDGRLYLALSGPEAARVDDKPLPAVTQVAEAIARTWLWVGGPGAAMAAKVLQNGLGLAQLVAMAEVLAACRAQAIDPRVFRRMVVEAGGMAASPLFERQFGRMIEQPERVEARLAIAAKDAALHCELVAPGSPDRSPAAASAATYADAVRLGLEDADFSAVWQVFTTADAVTDPPRRLSDFGRLSRQWELPRVRATS